MKIKKIITILGGFKEEERLKDLTTMKKSILCVFAMVALFAGCVNNTADEEKETKEPKEESSTQQGTTFIGGIAIKSTTTSTTRTSLSMVYPGGTQVDYFWEKGDKIWTADGANGEAQITTKSATAKFRLSQRYNTPTVTLYYPGKLATSYNNVTIAIQQNQYEPNTTDKLGDYGDCGTATAQRQPDNSYTFNLDHKAAYLCLLPYSSYKLTSAYISQVKITADNNIAGTYTLTKMGLTGNGSSNTIMLTTKAGSGVYANGFPLTNTDVSQNTNAIYAVIAPGTHALTIEYSYKDNITNIETTVTKMIASQNYLENTVYPILNDIKPKNYSSDGYFNWSAKEHLWAGREEDRLTINGTELNKIYPFAVFKRSMGVGGFFPLSGTNSCQNCPNANELLWYVKRGEPRWDDNIVWAVMGHLYKGGLWLKKKNNIAGYNPSAAPDDGKDYTTDDLNVGLGGNHGRFRYETTLKSVSSGDNLNDYFYLPALGLYYADPNRIQLRDIGIAGDYWSKTFSPWSNGFTYNLHFDRDKKIRVGIMIGCALPIWTAQ